MTIDLRQWVAAGGYGTRGALPHVTVLTVTMPSRADLLSHRARELQNQTYPWAEWIIVLPQAMQGASVTQMPHAILERITWILSDDAAIVPKRNLGASFAKPGTILIHVDDDDWQHPTRIARQVAALEGGLVVGTNWVYAYFRASGEIHRIAKWGSVCNVIGATMAYRKEAWDERHLDDSDEGNFTTYWNERGNFRDMQDPTLILYARHDQNFSGERQFYEPSRTGRRPSPAEILEARRRDPAKPLVLAFDDSALDQERLHLSDVNRAFWRAEMGDSEWRAFTGEGS